MKNHTDNYATHLCLAQLYELEGHKEAAMASYQRSISIRETRQGNERLAFLLAFEGEYKKSSELLRTALSITDGGSKANERSLTEARSLTQTKS